MVTVTLFAYSCCLPHILVVDSNKCVIQDTLIHFNDNSWSSVLPFQSTPFYFYFNITVYEVLC